MKYSAINIDKLHDNIYQSSSQVVTHLNLKKNEQIPDHSSDMSVVVVIYEGDVNFKVDNEIFNIKPGDIIQMDPDKVHSLKANENSRLMVIKSKLVK